MLVVIENVELKKGSIRSVLTLWLVNIRLETPLAMYLEDVGVKRSSLVKRTPTSSNVSNITPSGRYVNL